MGFYRLISRSLVLLAAIIGTSHTIAFAKIKSGEKSVANPLAKMDCVAALSLNKISLVRADGFPAFDQMPVGRLEKILDKMIIQSRLRIRGILQASDLPATFDTVVAPIDEIMRNLDFFENLLGIYMNSYITRESKRVEAVVTPMRTAFIAEIFSDPKLYKRLEAVSVNGESQTEEQSRLIDKYLQSFRLKGAHLNREKREKVQKLNKEISLLGTRYKNNLAQFSAENKIFVTDKDELKGVSEDLIKSFAHAAKIANRSGYLISLSGANYTEIMLNGENSNLQKRIWEIWGRRSYMSGPTDNSKIVPLMAQKRREVAELIGYKSHAEATLTTRMAGSLERVEEFHNEILQAFRPLAEKDAAELQAFVKEKTGSETLEPWRMAYWSRQLEKERFNLDQQLFREYLPADVVFKGLFDTIRRKDGLEFHERTDLPSPGAFAKIYEVRNRINDLVGYVIMDLYARDSKRDGAWMSQILTPVRKGLQRLPSVVTVNLNLTQPPAGEPLLFKVDEAETLYHEFGHALHGLLSRTIYHSTGATNVKWDFVELPSQMFEHYFKLHEMLKKYTRHYRTNQPVPDEMIESLNRAESFQKGLFILRQLSLQRIDLAWHSNDPRTQMPIPEFEKTALAPYRVFPMHEYLSVTSTAFHHIFSATDDYSAGYYSYMWADVLVANVIMRFKEEGFFNPEVAAAFQNYILAVGDSVGPDEAVTRFLGHKAVAEALLKLYGAK